MLLLVIVGSLQSRSSNRSLAAAFALRAPPNVEIVTCPFIGELPHYNSDLDTADPPEVVRQWRAQLKAADGVLILSPEYGHGVPGSLKNALDWIVGSGDFHNKPVAATCAAQGPERGRLGLAMLVQTLRAIDAKVAWTEPLIVPRASIDEQGQIADSNVDRQVDALLSVLLAEMSKLAE